MFRSGLVKLQERRVTSLTKSTSSDVKTFSKRRSQSAWCMSSNSVVVRACKHQKLSLLSWMATYHDVKYILPTSSIFKLLFSKAGYTLSSCLQRVLPSNIESQLFRVLNYSDWSIADRYTLSMDYLILL